jgi:hypothetical protein
VGSWADPVLPERRPGSVGPVRPGSVGPVRLGSVGPVRLVGHLPEVEGAAR